MDRAAHRVRRAPPNADVTEGSRVLIALRVPAEPGRAFDAFVHEIGAWWQPNGLFQFTDDRTGVLAFVDPGPTGRLVEAYDDGDVFEIGRIRVWEPPHRLALSWRHASFASDQETELHVRFDAVDAPRGGRETRVTVEHFGWDTIPTAHAARHGFPLAVFELRFAEWWRRLLEELGHLAEHRAPDPS
jgi:uncharacterized protein YndB with AHSA1/START domain